MPQSCMLCKARKTGWFCNLSPQSLADFSAMSTRTVFGMGDVLFTEGQPSRSVSVVCAGQVKLTRSSRDGRTLLVKITRPGDVLGLSAALSKVPYEVTAQAIERTQLALFEQQEFLRFIERHAEGSLRAAESLSNEYRSALTDASRLALSTSIAGRVAHLLLDLAMECETAQDARPKIHLSLRHEDLASMLGSSRESITRALNGLKRKGVISIKGGDMTILSKEALEVLL